MTKTMDEVLKENYSDFDPLLHMLIQDDGDGPYLRRDLWPSSWGNAPTDQQLTTWMSG